MLLEHGKMPETHRIINVRHRSWMFLQQNARVHPKKVTPASKHSEIYNRKDFHFLNNSQTNE
jgi:hypothetical protein